MMETQSKTLAEITEQYWGKCTAYLGGFFFVQYQHYRAQLSLQAQVLIFSNSERNAVNTWGRSDHGDYGRYAQE
jgi:hypothetical protein